MIIDPQTFIAVEMDRHLAAAEAARAARAAVGRPARRRRPRRSLALRLASWATGRAVQA
jgi:hypothetical protein